MPTVIDSLIVTLGLDAKAFSAGQKQAAADLIRTKEQTRATAGDMERYGKQAGNFFTEIRNQALALFAIFTAGRGIREFVRDITGGDAALGRMSRNMGISTSQLSAWEGALARTGGQTGEMTGFLNDLTQSLQMQALTGHSSTIPFFRALGVQIGDTSGKARQATDIALDLADAFQRVARTEGMPRAIALGAGIGASPQTVAFLSQGRRAVQQQIDEQTRRGGATERSAQLAQQLLTRLADIRTSLDDVLRLVLNDISPQILEWLKTLDKWMQENHKAISEGILKGIRDVATGLQAIPWQQIFTDLRQFGSVVDGIVKSLGGWKDVTEALFLAWSVNRVMRMVVGVGLLRAVTGLLFGAGARGAAGAAGRGVLGLIGGAVGMSGGAVAAVGSTVLLRGDTAANITPEENERQRIATQHFFNSITTGISSFSRDAFNIARRSVNSGINRLVPLTGHALNETLRGPMITPQQRIDEMQQFLQGQEISNHNTGLGMTDDDKRRILQEFLDRYHSQLGSYNPVAALPSINGNDNRERMRPMVPSTAPVNLRVRPDNTPLPQGATGRIAAFMAKYGPYAERQAQLTGTSARFWLAKWAQETRYGEAAWGNNLGNISATSGAGGGGTAGPIRLPDGRMYRSYRSVEDYLADERALTMRRYPGAINAGNDIERAAAALQNGVNGSRYAEDPNYAQHISNVARRLGGSNAQNPPTLQYNNWDKKPAVAPWVGNVPTPPVPDNNTTNNNATHNNHTAVDVNQINIHTSATDGKGIASEIGSAVRRLAFVPAFNTGLA